MRIEHRVSDYSPQKQNCTSVQGAGLIYRQAIFEEFEEESSDEEEDDEDDEDEDEDGLIAKIRGIDLDKDGDEDESGTGVLTSQLRHFVIQVCPLFFFSNQAYERNIFLGPCYSILPNHMVPHQLVWKALK